MWENLKQKFNAYTVGRNGVDELSTATLIFGVVMTLLAAILGIGLFRLLGLAAYFVTLFRMFSKDIDKRREENRKYLQASGKYRKEWNQFLLRRKNSKEYKYFRCPKCRQIIRAKRGSGMKHVVCKKCGNEFDKKC